MQMVCRALGVARSHVHELHYRSPSWSDGCKGRPPAGDVQLLAEIRQQITDLPSYGYRRACALVNRQRSAQGGARFNPKRAHRVMAQAGLLLLEAPRRRQSSRTHEGTVTVERSDLRWCSDGLEIKCNSGQNMTTTFAKNCCDREVIAWRAWEGKGLPGEPVREMPIEEVEKRFGSVEAVPWISGWNSSATTAAPTSQLRPEGSRVHWGSNRSTPRCGVRRATAWPRLRQHAEARLRCSHGPQRCGHRVGAVAGRIRALQRGAPALVVENAFTPRVPAASGRPSAPIAHQRHGITLRIGRVREYGGEITRSAPGRW